MRCRPKWARLVRSRLIVARAGEVVCQRIGAGRPAAIRRAQPRSGSSCARGRGGPPPVRSPAPHRGGPVRPPRQLPAGPTSPPQLRYPGRSAADAVYKGCTRGTQRYMAGPRWLPSMRRSGKRVMRGESGASLDADIAQGAPLGGETPGSDAIFGFDDAFWRLRTLSVAVRAMGRTTGRGYGHIADSVAVVNAIRWCLRSSEAM